MTSKTFHKIVVPVQQTLDKYGLTLDDWKALAKDAGYACGVCHELPESGRLVVDHEHVAGWKKMLPEERKVYVRGLACVTCNHFVLTRYATIAKHRGAAEFLERYERRRHQG